MTSKKKHCVFVASTFRDLKSYRDVAADAITELGFEVELVGSLDGLTDEEIVRVCQEKVRKCDACVLIVGFTRGGTPRIDEIGSASFTSLEVQAAEQASIPVFGFLVSEDSDGSRIDSKWVEEFRNQQKTVRVIAFVENEDDFRYELLMSLLNWFARMKPNDFLCGS